MIRRSQKLFAVRWRTYAVAAAAISLLACGYSLIPGIVALSLLAGIVLGTAAASLGLVTASRRLNQALASSLSLDEIRALIREWGRPGILQGWSGASDLLAHCLARLEKRSDLSQEEWEVIGIATTVLFSKLPREAVKLLYQAEVYEAAEWLKGTSTSSIAGGRRLRKLVAALGRMDKERRAELPDFAPTIIESLGVAEALESARQTICFGRSGLGVFVLLVGCTLLSIVAPGSSSFVPMLAAMSLGIRLLAVEEGAKSVPHYSIKGEVLPTLLEELGSEASRGRRKLLQVALRDAIRQTDDFSAMRLEHFERLLDLHSTAKLRDRAAIAQVIRDQAPAALYPSVQDRAERWLANRSRHAPRMLKELTEIRVGMLRRIESNKTPSLQEVP